MQSHLQSLLYLNLLKQEIFVKNSVELDFESLLAEINN